MAHWKPSVTPQVQHEVSWLILRNGFPETNLLPTTWHWLKRGIYVPTDSCCPHLSVILSTVSEEQTRGLTSPKQALFVSGLGLHNGGLCGWKIQQSLGAFWMNVGAGERSLSVCLPLYFLVYSSSPQLVLPLTPHISERRLGEIMWLNFSILCNFDITQNLSFGYKGQRVIRCISENAFNSSEANCGNNRLKLWSIYWVFTAAQRCVCVFQIDSITETVLIYHSLNEKVSIM